MSVQVRVAANLLSQVAHEQGEPIGEELAQVLIKAARDAQRVARALDTGEPLLQDQQ